MTQTPKDKEPTIADVLREITTLNQKLIMIEYKFDTSQKADDRVRASSERVANLAFTVVTASAAVVVLAPAVQVLAEFFARTMLK